MTILSVLLWYRYAANDGKNKVYLMIGIVLVHEAIDMSQQYELAAPKVKLSWAASK